MDLRRVDLEIEQRHRLNGFRREQGIRGQEFGNRSLIEEARTGAAIAGVERDTYDKDLAMQAESSPQAAESWVKRQYRLVLAGSKRIPGR